MVQCDKTIEVVLYPFLLNSTLDTLPFYTKLTFEEWWGN
jgi:hypothetical protein